MINCFAFHLVNLNLSQTQLSLPDFLTVRVITISIYKQVSHLFMVFRPSNATNSRPSTINKTSIPPPPSTLLGCEYSRFFGYSRDVALEFSVFIAVLEHQRLRNDAIPAATKQGEFDTKLLSISKTVQCSSYSILKFLKNLMFIKICFPLYGICFHDFPQK